MTQEEKQLLLKDLCSRLPYHVICRVITFNDGLYDRYVDDELFSVSPESEEIQMYRGSKYNYPEEVKPYLRPMSSMTEEEVDELIAILNKQCTGRVISKDNFELTSFGTLWFTNMKEYECVSVQLMAVVIDYCNAHHFDYRGLIPMGLALEAPEGMYEKF